MFIINFCLNMFRLVGIDAVGSDPDVVDVVSLHFTAMTEECHFKHHSG